MQQQSNVAEYQENSCENPLIWPIFEILKHQPSEWKVHILAAELVRLDYISQLDSVAEKDMFKRNFLIMNALYQLQEMLYPDKWLQVQAMDIRLCFSRVNMQHVIDNNDPLREYYLNWENYDADASEVKRLLNEFWTRYKDYIDHDEHQIVADMSREKALRLFRLEPQATYTEIRKTWRKLALRWHPDREHGDAGQFRILCEAWHVLR